MISAEKQAEIEKLEAEQAEIKARIKSLKEDTKLHFGEIKGYESLNATIRKLVLEIAGKPAPHHRDVRSCKKISELSQEQIKIMNAFIGEIAPIINKYIEINASLFEAERK